LNALMAAGVMALPLVTLFIAAHRITSRGCNLERKHQTGEAGLILRMQSVGDTLLNRIHLGVWELDLVDQTTTRTSGHDRIFGYETLLPLWNHDLFLTHVVPEDRGEVDRIYQKALVEQAEWRIECRIRRADGVVRWILAVGAPQLDSHGLACRLAGIIQDITERKHQADQFRQVVEMSPFGLLEIDAQGCIGMVNQSLENMFGYVRAELIGQPVDVLLPQRLRAAHMQHRGTFMASPATRKMGSDQVLLARRKNGDEFNVEIGLSPMSTGQSLRVLASIVDISERVRAQQLLSAQRKELLRSNEELSTFAYVASHDLKSPLRGIGQLSQWIEEDLAAGNGAAVADHMRLLRSRLKRMENLLDGLLAYSRAGKSDDSLGPIDVRQVARELFNLQAPPASMQLVVADDLPAFTTLRTPFELVLRNLFSNAIKHHDQSPQGHIDLSGQPLSNGYYEFSVRDDGPGIPVLYQERVFGMFQTLRPRDEVEGSGMGLALVKKVVETYGGTVGIDSDGVRGCCIRFSWPLTLERK
jgi:PAS domain S-box-containing protein